MILRVLVLIDHRYDCYSKRVVAIVPTPVNMAPIEWNQSMKNEESIMIIKRMNQSTCVFGGAWIIITSINRRRYLYGMK